MGTPRKKEDLPIGKNPKTDKKIETQTFNFWQELKRRKTIRVITVYSATAFIILQVADLIVEPLKLPDWTVTFLIILLFIGFLFAAGLSWIYDITPEGIQKTGSGKISVRSVKDEGKEKTNRWKIVSAACIVIIVILLGFNIYSHNGLNNNDVFKLEKSIAVLPFRNDSPSDTNAYFINGIMEEVLNHLQMIKDLRVISRTSVEQYRNTTKSIPEIAKEQGVNFIVEGSGQKYGNSFTVKVQLVRAVKESYLWGNSYEKEIRVPADIISVQSEISKSIVSELKATITPQEQKQIEKIPTANLNAYDFYQRGRGFLTDYIINSDNRKALEQAEMLFKKSIEFDTEFADAIAGQALVYLNKHYWISYVSDAQFDSVLILSNLALSYDDKLAEAYFAKGEYFAVKGIMDKALIEFDKALEFNPNYWQAYIGKSMAYDKTDIVKSIQNLQKAASINNDKFSPTINRMIGGKFLISGYIDEAKRYFNRAFEIDKDSAFLLSCLGGTERDQGNYKKSIEYFSRALVNRPDYSEVAQRLLDSYLFNGQHEAALKIAKNYPSIAPDQPDDTFDTHIAYSYWLNGYHKEADYYFNKQLEFCTKAVENYQSNSDMSWVYFNLSTIYAFKGDIDNALKYLSLFSKSRSAELWMVTIVEKDPLLERIRNESAYKQILENLKNEYQVLHKQVGQWIDAQKEVQK